jgi:hypothetical protein
MTEFDGELVGSSREELVDAPVDGYLYVSQFLHRGCHRNPVGFAGLLSHKLRGLTDGLELNLLFLSQK